MARPSSALVGCAVAGILFAGCTVASPILRADEVAGVTSTLAEATSTLAEVEDVEEYDIDETKAAVFLAAVEEGLAGTKYSGTAFADPETYIITAGLFCSLLEDGLTGSEVMTAYIAALSDANGEIDDDDLVAGSVILGAGVQVFCPDFLEALDV